jgi:hypothetical protein
MGFLDPPLGDVLTLGQQLVPEACVLAACGDHEHDPMTFRSGLCHHSRRRDRLVVRMGVKGHEGVSHRVILARRPPSFDALGVRGGRH